MHISACLLLQVYDNRVTTRVLLTSASYQGTQQAEFPASPESHIIGSCTGLLAAAAVSSCKSLVDLLPVSVEVVKLSYRIGSLVGRTANHVEQGCDGPQSWALAVTGLREEQVIKRLDDFHHTNVGATLTMICSSGLHV